ncbi:hypothetical protein NTH_00997 [Nitratireductor thuwali]|uniref:L-ornithine N(alpha)-acyltransferase n=1 Tax=Nitratireductor thuwali TaxID=2267699 RepID=A0ABY5MEU1_9HYPH|nr:hypothetical protein NTH_00997 [Nitratireductor thuwali]
MKNITTTPDATIGSIGQIGGRLGRAGSLEARVTTSEEDIQEAQRIRYKVFYEELSATPTPVARRARRDVDAFDPICDHLVILDRDRLTRQKRRPIVGTYRLLRQEVAEAHQGFYSASEFEISDLVQRNRPLQFLELGRSCVLPGYRRKRTLELLWHAIWRYCLMHRIDVLFGCASLPGTDVDRFAVPLSFLHHTASAPPQWYVRAVPSRRIEMNRIEPGKIDRRSALRLLPPLVRGYLNLGAYFGDGAVADEQFKTIDVMTVLPVSRIRKGYITYFDPDAGRQKAQP